MNSTIIELIETLLTWGDKTEFRVLASHNEDIAQTWRKIEIKPDPVEDASFYFDELDDEGSVIVDEDFEEWVRWVQEMVERVEYHDLPRTHRIEWELVPKFQPPPASFYVEMEAVISKPRKPYTPHPGVSREYFKPRLCLTYHD